MADLRRVHRFRDHTVAGVNWRPTRLFDELPSFRVCDLCRMIAKRILVLPCSHVLCQACHAASCQGGSDGLCPMDREPFVGAECSGHDFPARKASALKVYCWNEQHGCGFVGATEDMLQHYEKECAFHIIDCFRCGDGVRHSDLSSHYASGCTSGLSSKGAGDASLESTAAIVRDVRASLEEMMAQLVNPDRDQLMSSIQSRMNELTQQMREHEFRLAEFTREVDESTEAEMAQVAASISSKMAGQPRYQSSETAEQVSTTSLQLLRPEKSKTCRQPYLFANLPLGVLQAMRLTSSQDYPQHVVSNCGPRDVKCHLYLTAPLSTTRTWREVEGSVKYVLTLKNCDMDVPAMEKSTIFAQVTVLHTRDAYFTVEVDKNYLFLFVRIGFHGLLAGPQCSMPSFRVKLLDGEPGKSRYLSSLQEPCRCKGDDYRLLHFRRVYSIDADCLQKNDFVRGRKLELEIEVSRKETAHSPHRSS